MLISIWEAKRAALNIGQCLIEVQRLLEEIRYSGIVAGISYVDFVLKDSKKKIGLLTFFYLPFWPTPPSPHASICRITALANFWRPHFLL